MSLFCARNLSKASLQLARCSSAVSAKPLRNPPAVLLNRPNYRLATTDTRGLDVSEGGVLKKVVGKVKSSLHKQKLKVGGFQLYETVADRLDYHTFMSELKMPDTFHSWFLVTELHCWMLSVRLMAHPGGKLLRNYLLEALWKDVNIRVLKLGVEHSVTARRQVSVLAEEFQAALVTYDEGLLDDKTLASAIWRRLLNRSPDANSRHLEILVAYIRSTLLYLDKLTIDELVIERKVQWAPARKLFEVKQ